jgi:hypothetical protein
VIGHIKGVLLFIATSFSVAPTKSQNKLQCLPNILHGVFLICSLHVKYAYA